MKIVSWNCNGKFREKWRTLFDAFPDADIFIVDECEDPDFYNDSEYRNIFAKGFHAGTPDYFMKGIGVFSLNGHHLQRMKCKYSHPLMMLGYAPFKVDNCQKILAVWPHGKYVEEMMDFLALNESLITKDLVIIGDTNSNSMFNRVHPKEKNHDAMVAWLQQKGLVDAYNHLTGEEEGKETMPTFYQWRHEDQPFHLDRAFVSPQRLKSFSIIPKQEHSEWLKISDHMPIVLEITDQSFFFNQR